MPAPPISYRGRAERAAERRGGRAWRRAASLIVLSAALLFRVGRGQAHDVGLSDLTLQVTGQLIEVRLSVGRTDAAALLGADPPAAHGDAHGAGATPRVAAAVAGWVRVRSDHAWCTAGAPSARAAADPGQVAVVWQLRCRTPPRALELDFEAFFARDSTAAVVLRVRGGSAALDTIVTANDSPLRLDLDRRGARFARWLRLGVEHILTGADHLCFLLALLLAAVLTSAAEPRAAAAPPRAAVRWRLRTLAESWRAAALVVTAFSLAHSLALLAATLGWVAAPTRLVETAIALSIGYAAIENVIAPQARWRGALTFGFGLIHGLGFAGALRELLPAADTTIPLLAFNLGVELGQIMIIAVSLPFLLRIGGALGAARYRSVLLPSCSAVLAALALLWSLERALPRALW